MASLSLDIQPVTLPMVRAFNTSQGRVSAREVTILRLRGEGRVGYGEASPLPFFSEETTPQVIAALHRWVPLPYWPDQLDEVDLWLTDSGADALPPTARFGVEVALLDGLARARGLSLARLLSRDARGQVAVNATITDPTTPACFSHTAELIEQGHTCFKLKVGLGTIEEDVKRARAVRDAAGDHARLRLDVNGAWTRDQAHEALKRLAPLDIDYIEQPLARGDEAGLAWLRSLQIMRIAADESAHSMSDLVRLLDLGAVDVVILKPAMIGGLLRALSLQREALRRGVQAIYTTLMDGAIGRAAVTHLAAASEQLAGPCGLATGNVFTRDVTVAPARPSRGMIGLGQGVGVGVKPELVRFEGDIAPIEGLPQAAIEVPIPLVQRAQTQPDHPALRSDDLTWSYATLYDHAKSVARGLYAQGVRPGQRVGVMAWNAPSVVALVHGIGLLGATLVAIHPRLTGAEAIDCADRAGCDMVVLDAEARQKSGPQQWPCPTTALHELPTSAPQPELTLRERVSLHEPFGLLFTSGTSGSPKVAVLTWQNIIFSATGSAIQLGHLPSDRWLLVLPLCHVGGLSVVTRCALLGTTIVMPRRFEAAPVARAIARGEVTLASFVARQLWQIVEAMQAEQLQASATFRAALLGGGPVPPGLCEAAQALGIACAPTYGMTEACSQIVTRAPEREASAPLIWTELRLVGGASADEGEVEVRGPTVSPGYLVRRGEGWALDQRGEWLATGDWGRMRPEGLELLDRRRDLIVTGGENVYPAEIERVLEGCEGVAEACVLGLPDPQWGERVVAVVVARAGASLEAASLEACCREQLADFKVPRTFYAWDALPRVGLGKLSREALRRQLARQTPPPLP